MIFGSVPIRSATGAILAHSMPSSTGRVPKGTVLTPAHVDDLEAAGHDTLVVARLEAGDTEENTAASALATAIVVDEQEQGLRIAPAGAGRVNLYATGPGVVQVDASAVAALNAVDPMITLATVPQFHRVDAGTMVATIKIISYAVPQTHLDRACAVASSALSVARPTVKTATLIETRVGTETLPGKGRAAMTGRLDRLEIALDDRCVVAHETEALAGAIRKAQGEMILILTASATSDICDVAPEALRQAGGTVTAYGMPVDPGNLLFFGTLSGRPVIGLPGCARSPALNGADWVLERLACGIAMEQGDISAMGVGGLLKEIPTRPRPRSTGP
ncbi:molybdopterin-binding protein [uncultured Tateyamaria sp.]|uniref:molybdopterin-binding protein n=1 Tax=uncultured Tateyamaria sp. TaxID=455651 RepID=UPI00261E807F|nr:molybdopterin-binding protein [uncultured Tateyamaria sp.]